MRKIWAERDEDYYQLPSLTDKDIEKAELLFNNKLPEAYLAILRIQNGGEIRYNASPTKESDGWQEAFISIDHIMGIGKEPSILNTPYFLTEWGMPKDVVLLSGDGQTWIALDYRDAKDSPSVIYIDNELEKELKLADSFQEFINGLYVEEDETEPLSSDWVEREWTMEACEIAFSSTDDMEIGYALEYLFKNPTEHGPYIEQTFIRLLKSDVLEIKQLVANFAYHYFNEKTISTACVEEIISILQNDKEVDYYAEWFLE